VIRFRIWITFLVVSSLNADLMAAWLVHNFVVASTFLHRSLANRFCRNIPYYRRIWMLRLPDGKKVLTDFVGLSLIAGIYFERLHDAYDDFRPRPGWIVVDVGAHMGFYTVRAAALVGSSGRVIAVEPDPANYAILKRNVQQCNLTNVTAVNAALSDRDGIAQLRIDDWASTGRVLIQNEANSDFQSSACVVKTMRLDTLTRELEIEKVDLVKIDVEGAEMLVLKGAKECLEKSTARIVVETHGFNLADQVAQLLRGYRDSVRMNSVVRTPDVTTPPYVYAS
jgi:FkbM family methyltransferase